GAGRSRYIEGGTGLVDQPDAFDHLEPAAVVRGYARHGLARRAAFEHFGQSGFVFFRPVCRDRYARECEGGGGDDQSWSLHARSPADWTMRPLWGKWTGLQVPAESLPGRCPALPRCTPPAPWLAKRARVLPLQLFQARQARPPA